MEKQWEYIDKSYVLDKCVSQFSSVYIEGAAASGKSVLIEQLMRTHSEEMSFLFCFKKGKTSQCIERLHYFYKEHSETACWYIFEDIDLADAVFFDEIYRFIENLDEKSRVVMTGRQALPEVFMDLYWKRKLDILPQHVFALTREDIRQLVYAQKCAIRPEKLVELTGGWPGCVEVIIRLGAMHTRKTHENQLLTEILESRIFKNYLKKEILDVLDPVSLQVMQLAIALPWIDVELCRQIAGIDVDSEKIRQLTYQGYLLAIDETDIYKSAPLFKYLLEREEIDPAHFMTYIKWYEDQNDIQALWQCISDLNDPGLTLVYMCRYMSQMSPAAFKQIPVSLLNGDTLLHCYLRCLNDYEQGEFDKITDERLVYAQKMSEFVDYASCNLYLNLAWLDYKVSIEEWFDLLTALPTFDVSYQLYQVVGHGLTSLSGIRDLSPAFACSRKEENRRIKLIQSKLDQKTQIHFVLAKMDYYVETDRIDSFRDDFYQALQTYDAWHGDYELLKDVWIIFNRMDRRLKNAALSVQITKYYGILQNNLSADSLRQMELYNEIERYLSNESDTLALWLYYSTEDNYSIIEESNIWYMLLRAKGYLLLEQYDLAKVLHDRLHQYIHDHRRYRFSAEFLYQQALVSWQHNEKAAALKYIIEMFLISHNMRYVDLYRSYGKQGSKLLEAYVEWQIDNDEQGFKRKKKYNYGQVLRMPEADYVQVLIREIKKNSLKDLPKAKEKPVDHLTMMEVIILQNINAGYSNAEIAQLLTIQMTTVKSHIYSIYKKLGVNSRTQAIISAKELKIIK